MSNPEISIIDTAFELVQFVKISVKNWQERRKEAGTFNRLKNTEVIISIGQSTN